jgi:hypothetical protein
VKGIFADSSEYGHVLAEKKTRISAEESRKSDGDDITINEIEKASKKFKNNGSTELDQRRLDTAAGLF